MKIRDILTPSFRSVCTPQEGVPSIVERCRADDSDFCREVVAKGWLTEEQMARAAMRYRLGKSKSGRCIFWMIDELGIVRDGHILGAGTQGWVSVMLKARAPKLLRDWHANHCLFGQHLLGHICDFRDFSVKNQSASPDKSICEISVPNQSANPNKSICEISVPNQSACPNKSICEISVKNQSASPDKSICEISVKNQSACPDKKICEICEICVTNPPICLVESESSAVILSELFPECLWLATAYPVNFSVSSFECLQGRDVVLFPPTDETMDTYLAWCELAEEARRRYHLHVNVQDLLERNATAAQKQAKIDLVDFLFPHTDVFKPHTDYTDYTDKFGFKSSRV